LGINNYAYILIILLQAVELDKWCTGAISPSPSGLPVGNLLLDPLIHIAEFSLAACLLGCICSSVIIQNVPRKTGPTH
jgi:hypothetical protein